MVAFDKDGERKIGDPAKRQAVNNPKGTIYSIKRFMGEKYSHVEKEAQRMPYTVKQGPNDSVRVEVNGRDYSPQEISAMVLQKMKTNGRGLSGRKSRTCRDHGAGLLQRFAASGHQGGR